MNICNTHMSNPLSEFLQILVGMQKMHTILGIQAENKC